MNKPEKMKKIRIIGLRDCVEDVIRALHETCAIEITDASKKVVKYPGVLENDVPLDKYSSVSDSLVRLRSLKALLPKYSAQIKQMGLQQALTKVPELAPDRMFSYNTELEELKAKIPELQKQIIVLDKLQHLNVDFANLHQERLVVTVGSIPTKDWWALEKKLKDAKFPLSYAVKRISKTERVVLFIADRKHAGEAASLLLVNFFTKLEVPSNLRKPADKLAEVRAELINFQTRKSELESLFADYAKTKGSLLDSVLYSLDAEAEQAEIASKFARSSNTFIIEGWVLARRVDELSKRIRASSKRAVFIEELKTREQPPTYLKNNPTVANFENIVTFISMPKHDEFDPTLLYALFFPIIFGLMVGDIAYGVVIMLLGIVGYKKLSGMLKSLCFALIPAGFWTIVWGIIFGEYLGFEFQSAMSRVENVPLLLGMTIAVGAIQLFLGYFIGFLKEAEHKNWPHALAKVAWMGVISAGAIFVFSAQIGPFAGTLALVLVVLSVAIIAATEGIIGIVEIPGLIGNILSFMRIAAVGLGGIALAVIINQLKPDPSMGLIAIPLALVYVVAHLSHVVLATFEGLVQGSRLQYVEFFSKFYSGGGRRFAPFGEKFSIKR